MTRSPQTPPSLIEIDPAFTLRQVLLPDRIYAALKHRILTCVLLPGKRIAEQELAGSLQVSRTPLREALNRLALENLVVLMPHRGYVVAPLTIEGIHELSEVRRINEPEAAALAATRVTDAALAGLATAARTQYAIGAPATYETYLRDNSLFHLSVVRATRNARLEGIVMAALDQLQRAEYLGLDTAEKQARIVTGEHMAIVEALRTHDAPRARRLMRAHIVASEQRIINALKASDFWQRQARRT
ncbi:MAG: GntR family transcriptional regulator [Acidobacteria bacterium]|nr:GntR family transcriptional regulator [Acidobacteriota bacterium]